MLVLNRMRELAGEVEVSQRSRSQIERATLQMAEEIRLLKAYPPTPQKIWQKVDLNPAPPQIEPLENLNLF